MNPVTAGAFAEDLFQGGCGKVDYGIMSIETKSRRIKIGKFLSPQMCLA